MILVLRRGIKWQASVCQVFHSFSRLALKRRLFYEIVWRIQPENMEFNQWVEMAEKDRSCLKNYAKALLTTLLKAPRQSIAKGCVVLQWRIDQEARRSKNPLWSLRADLAHDVGKRCRSWRVTGKPKPDEGITHLVVVQPWSRRRKLTAVPVCLEINSTASWHRPGSITIKAIRGCWFNDFPVNTGMNSERLRWKFRPDQHRLILSHRILLQGL